jgi:hypothetical protein
MNSINLKLFLALFITFIALSAVSAQRGKGPVKENPPIITGNISLGPCNKQNPNNILKWKLCVCDKYPWKDICKLENKVDCDNNVDLLPSASFSERKLTIDTQIEVTNAHVQIYNIFNSNLEYDLNDYIKDRGILVFNEIVLENGVYVAIMNFNGFFCKSQFVVYN